MLYNLVKFVCVQNNECQQNLGEIRNSLTSETYTSYQLAEILNIHFSILDTNEPKLQPVNFVWKLFINMLILNQFFCEMPKEFIITCVWIIAVVRGNIKRVWNTISVNIRGLFTIQSTIYNEAILQKQLTAT